MPRLRWSHIAGLSLSALCLGAVMAPGGSAAPRRDANELGIVRRISWGETTTSVAEAQRAGVAQWIDRQLHPPARDALPPQVQAMIDGLPINQKPTTDWVRDLQAQNQALNQLTDPDQKKTAQQAYQQALSDLAKQAATRSLLRDLYSPDQLKEEMTWFWMNHFNVFQGKANIRAMVGDYEETAIRPHALGRFRDLLEATLQHPAMLRYLDNADNAVGRINENYAREIMELHTMGVGSGYSQKDVQELARILTGVGIDARPEDPRIKPELQSQLIRKGLFEFNPARHDYGDKLFLGRTIHGRGYGEIQEALDLLCSQPATARHISMQLATFFVGDNPPQSLVDRTAAAFLRSDGDIASTLSALFHAPEFHASLGQDFKDPVHYAISAVRLAYDDHVILNTQPIQNWLNRMGEGLYNHETPDGYALTSAAWAGPGQMAIRFEIARQIGAGSAGLFKADAPTPVDHPAFPQLQNRLYFDALEGTMSAQTKASFAQAASPQEWNALFLSSPEFMNR